MRFLITAAISIFFFIARGQSDLSAYLARHHYAFSLEKGFEGSLADTLAARLAGYRVVLQAEGGSHYLHIYEDLQMDWLRFLQKSRGLHYFLGESGPASAVLYQRYLQTGDTSSILSRYPGFWKKLYSYNATLPEKDRLQYEGLDFDWPVVYFRALKALVPDAPPRETIREDIASIRAVPDSMRDCDYTLAFNTRLKRSLSGHRQDFMQYFDRRFPDLQRIILNESTCKDVRQNRNPKLAGRFFAFHQRVGEPLYYGEFGQAHLPLNRKVLASIIDRQEPFRGKVAVINLYCHDCSTPVEATSNWVLEKIEPDILRYFLPFCEGDCTIFDLTDPNEAVKPYSAYGQFLIIARRQH